MTDQFTPVAARRWKRISLEAQGKILANVWCGNCRSAVQIILGTAEIQSKVLILKGKCKTCGKDVCRIVEPED